MTSAEAQAVKPIDWRGVRTLKDRYPDAASVGEVLRLAGLDRDLGALDVASSPGAA